MLTTTNNLGRVNTIINSPNNSGRNTQSNSSKGSSTSSQPGKPSKVAEILEARKQKAINDRQTLLNKQQFQLKDSLTKSMIRSTNKN